MKPHNILLLEDEPLILLDLEFAAEDLGCQVYSASSCSQAMDLLEANSAIDVAVLDVSLQNDETCFPVAEHLKERGIPFILHSGNLDRHDESIRNLNALLIAKPAAAEKVIGTAIARAQGDDADAL